jgi:hypothetical protein
LHKKKLESAHLKQPDRRKLSVHFIRLNAASTQAALFFSRAVHTVNSSMDGVILMRVLCRTFLAFPIAIFVLLTLCIVLVLESRRSAPRWVENGL